MTLRLGKARRRYALSQYATVRGFSLAARMVWFLFPFYAVGVRLTLISRRFRSAALIVRAVVLEWI